MSDDDTDRDNKDDIGKTISALFMIYIYAYAGMVFLPLMWLAYFVYAMSRGPSPTFFTYARNITLAYLVVGALLFLYGQTL